MSYKEFLQQIELQVKDRMGQKVRTFIVPVMKNNSVRLDGLSILQEGDNVSPAIYLNEYYRNYQRGEPLEAIVDKVMEHYRLGSALRTLDTSFFTRPEKVKERIVCRLVNFEKNKKLLQEVPYRVFLDLAIVYYCMIEHEVLGNASVLIRREHMTMWGLDEQTIYTVAVQNTKRLMPCDFISMSQLLGTMMQSDLSDGFEAEVPLFILSNREKNYGAIWMTDPQILEEIGEKLQCDYYVLPSSVHECVIIPADEGTDEQMLHEMVKEINETQVEPEEVLSDTVYRYERERKALCVRYIQGRHR